MQQNEAFTILKLALDRVNSLVSNDLPKNKFVLPELLIEVIQEFRFCNSVKTSVLMNKLKLDDIDLAGDGEIFKTILFNLLNNAVNASSTEIKITVSEAGPFIKVSILDNGKGIEKKFLNFIGKTGISLAFFRHY